MDLTPYIDDLRRQLADAAATGGEDARALAERITAPLDSAVRLTLLNVLSAAMDEVTRELAPGSVEVRLRGLDPGFVVTPPPGETPGSDTPSASAPPSVPLDTEDGATSRINLRLPAQLKSRVEDAANREGLSVNAWLVRALASAVEPTDRGRRSSPSGSQRYTGWVR